MIPELRSEFNRRWRPELYAEFLRRVDECSGAHVSFRLSETPVFLPRPLVDKMVRYGLELYRQLARNPEYLKAARGAIPSGFTVPNEAPEPLFLQADFGLVREPDGSLEPKLVEIQGFPSIYAFQTALAREYQRTYDLASLKSNLTTYLDGLDELSYQSLLERVILNDHDPRQVVLLEIDPQQQKTLPDFLITQNLLGLKIADIRDLERRGSKLYLNGVEIKRIYNRVIAEELSRRNIASQFRFTDEVDVEWAGHPNWFFLISKFSLPWLKHPCVPETRFLSDIESLPDDLDRYVLKPLYSFAGSGVTIGPKPAEIDAITPQKRSEFILQRRLEFVPTVQTPSGPTKVEIRIMYVWDGEMKPVTVLLRTGRGKMMGVDFNKNLDWVGASAAFF